MQNLRAYSKLAPLKEEDPTKAFYTKNVTKNKDGTEVRVLTFAPTEDTVIPAEWEILDVEYDRSMSVTRVTVSRPYDAEKSAKEKEAAAGPPASPSYPQPPGGVPAPAVDPSSSYSWGSIDPSKVQNIEDLKHLPPSIAEQEASQKEDEQKDTTEVASEEQTDANAESADKSDPALQEDEKSTSDKAADKKDSEKEAKEAKSDKAKAEAPKEPV